MTRLRYLDPPRPQTFAWLLVGLVSIIFWTGLVLGFIIGKAI
jgi:uncharacterized membrane protein